MWSSTEVSYCHIIFLSWCMLLSGRRWDHHVCTTIGVWMFIFSAAARTVVRLKVAFGPIVSNWKPPIHHFSCSSFFSDGVKSAHLVHRDPINCLECLVINVESLFDIFYHWWCNVGKFDAVSEQSCNTPPIQFKHGSVAREWLEGCWYVAIYNGIFYIGFTFWIVFF